MEKATVIWKAEGPDAPAGTVPCDQLNPREQFLNAIALCAAKTVLSLLAKMRVRATSLTVELVGSTAEPIPQPQSVYNGFTEIYHIDTVARDTESKVRRAVSLAYDTHCCMTVMAKKIAPVRHEIVLNGQLLPYLE